jgi:RimJ/RimL family protein N-acetyltransferase
MPHPAGRISHALRKARQEGPRAALGRAFEIVRQPFYRQEEHVWYQLDVNAERPRREFVEGVRLLRAGPDDAARVESLGQVASEARERLAAGNDLWLAVDEQDRELFACWTFRSETPVYAAPHGELPLPAGTACLEDSVAAPLARGKGIAPASWTAIADALAAEGFQSMITKVTTDNAPSRKAVQKSGFKEIAIMRLTQVGPRRSVALSSLGGVAPAIARGLGA